MGGVLNTAGLALRRRPSLRGDDKSWNFDVSSLACRNTQWEKGKNIAPPILFRPSTRARMVAPTRLWGIEPKKERTSGEFSCQYRRHCTHTHKYWSQPCVRVLCADVCAERMHNKCRRRPLQMCTYALSQGGSLNKLLRGSTLQINSISTQSWRAS